jgi:RHS repeat-associated protein
MWIASFRRRNLLASIALLVSAAAALPSWAQPPLMSLQPADGSLLGSRAGTLTGRAPGAVLLQVDGHQLAIGADGGFSHAFSLPEGESALSIYAEDADGLSTSQVHHLEIDSLAPGIVVGSPAQTRVGATPVEVAGTVQEAHLAGVTVRGSPAGLSGNSFSATVSLAEGAQNVAIVATDDLGRSTTVTLVLTLDTQAPTIAVAESGAPFAGGLFDRPITPQITLGDAGSFSSEILLDGSPYESGTQIAAEGAHRLEIAATDAVGNSASREIDFTLDFAAPSFGQISPAAGAVLAGATVTLQVEATGAASVKIGSQQGSASGNVWSIGPLSLTEGSQELVIEAFDAAGNRAERRHALIRDTIAPNLQIVSPAQNAVLTASPATIAGTAFDPRLASVRVNGELASLTGSNFSISVALEEGANGFAVEALDSAGNASNQTLNLTLDTTAPSFTVKVGGVALAGGEVFSAAITPTIELSEPAATVTATLDGASFTFGAAISVDGDHQLGVTVSHNGLSSSNLFSFRIDRQAPVFGALSPAEGSVLAAASALLEGSVQHAASLSIDGAPVALANGAFAGGPYTLAAGASRTFVLLATSSGGLTTEKRLTLVQDGTQPQLAILQPAENALLGSAAVSVSGTASDPHLLRVRVSGIDAQVSASSWLASGVSLAEGSNSLTVVAEDRAGNQRQLSRTVVRDMTDPEVAITEPAAGTVVPAAAYTVRGTATDAHLDRVEVNGRRATLQGSDFHLEVALVEGANNVEAVAIDKLGRRSTATVSITRDSDAPQVQIQVPAEGFATRAATIEVRGAYENEAGTTVKVNGLVAVLTTGHFEALAVPLVPGENRITARAVDAQGNEGVHTRTVWRDEIAPTFVRLEPAAGALSLPVNAVFRISFSEEMAEPETGAILLATAAGAPLAFAAEVVGKDLVLTPSAPLPPQTTLRLTLTAGLEDRAGNALSPVPAYFELTTADTGAPGAPVLSATPAATGCRRSVLLAGTAEALAQVRAEGGAAAALTRAGEDGAFSLEVQLLPEQPSVIRLVAIDALGNESPELVLQLAADCTPPRVESAEIAGAAITVTFSEAVAAPAGAFRLASAGGAEAFGYALSGSVATLTLGAAPSGLLELAVGEPGGGVVEDLAGNDLAFPWRRLFGAGAGDSFVAGTVFDDGKGQPLAGALVSVTSTNGVALADPLPQVTTAADGRFLLGLPAGTHDVTFARPGYAPVFRVVTTAAGEGTHVFDPRLTLLNLPSPIGAAGGAVADGAARLELPAGAFASDQATSITQLSEQALPALLPYGFSPRGAVYVAMAATPSVPGTLTIPVETATGREVVVASLDFALLQWKALAVETVAGGSLEIEIDAPGAYVVVEADAESATLLQAVIGQVLPSLPAPEGDEIEAAAVDFAPTQVLPSQRSRATVSYTLADAGTPAPSGLPLTLAVQERLTLLDGSERRAVPYSADLLVFRAPDGEPRSRFWLQPSPLAASLPIEIGAEDVSIRTFGETTVRGNILGPDGGSVLGSQGDLFEVPAGALTRPTAVTVRRRTAGDLPHTAPAGFPVLGVLEVDLGGVQLSGIGRLTLATDDPPAAGARGLLLGTVEIDGQPRWQALSELEPVAAGWRTVETGGSNPPWPGVRRGGLYLAIELEGEWGLLEGELYDAEEQLVAGGVVASSAVPWLQLSTAEGGYVLPLPAAAAGLVVSARDSQRDQVAVALPTLADGDRLELDLQLLPTGPTVVEIKPADSAIDVPVTYLPEVTFSESVARASLAAGLRLLLDGQPVAVELDHQDDRVIVEPLAPLRPDTTYQLEVASAIEDLQGRHLSLAVTITFRTAAAPAPPPGIDASKVQLFEPDSQGLAKVVGLPGAVPASSLVWVENFETITITSGSDGSFELEVPAALGDLLYLSVLIPGQSAGVLRLQPWLLRQGSGAYVGPGGGKFTSASLGLEVEALPGTFTGLTKVTIETVAPPVDHHPVFNTVLDFKLDLGGAVALKPLQLRVPAPAGGTSFLLSRYTEALGRRGWMLMDLMHREGDELVTGPEAGAGAAVLELRSEQVAAMAGVRFEVPSRRVLSMAEAAALRAGQFNPRAARPIPGASQLSPESLENAPQAAGGRRLTGARVGGTYQITFTDRLISLISFPAFDRPFGLSWFQSIPAFVVKVIDELLEPNPVLYLPVWGDVAGENQGTEVQILDLDSGYIRFHRVFPPPTVPDLEIPAADLADTEPPIVEVGTPLRFFVIHTVAKGPWSLGGGVNVEIEPLTVRVTGGPASASPGAEIRLFGLDSNQEEMTHASANGEFNLSAAVVKDNDRLLLAIGGRVGPSERIELGFFDGLANLDGVDLFPSDEQGFSAGPVVSIKRRTDALGRTWSLIPQTGWRAGFYQLRIGTQLRDANGNAWPRPFSLTFEVPEAAAVSDLPAGIFSDFARIGNVLGVVSQTDGLRLWDVSDPASPLPFLAEDEPYRFAGGGSMRGLAVEDHGRFVVVGSGEQFPGQLHVIDPLVMSRIDENMSAVWPTGVFGYSTLTNAANQGNVFPTTGLPRRVATLNVDQAVEWVWGVDAPPEGLQIFEFEDHDNHDFELTISGPTQFPFVPVSLRNASRGLWQRVYADDASHFEAKIHARPGEVVQLSRGLATFAYTTINGYGLAGLNIEDIRGGVASELNSLARTRYTPGFDLSQAPPCGQSIASIDNTPIEVAVLKHSSGGGASIVTLVRSYGLAIFTTNQDDPRQLDELSVACGAVGSEVVMTGLDVVAGYPIDLDHDGEIRDRDDIGPNGEPLPKEIRDFAVVTSGQGWVLLFDLTNPAKPNLVGKVKVGRLGGTTSATGPMIDPVMRRIYVGGFGGGVYVINFDSILGVDEIDQDHDSYDDRVVETILVGADELVATLAMPDLGVLWAGSRQNRVSGISVAGPNLQIVSADHVQQRALAQLAPFGVPTARESQDSPHFLPGIFRVWAAVATNLPELRVDILSIGPGGEEIDPAGWGQELPSTSFKDEQSLVLTRQAENPWEIGYNIFTSEPVVAIADLRAAIGYHRSGAEDEVCYRCDQVALGVYEEQPSPGQYLRELLSGDQVKVDFTSDARQSLEQLYGERLGQGTTVYSTPWEISRAVEQESPGLAENGIGIAPGLFCPSGEFQTDETDLSIRSGGSSFVFSRHYRSATVGAGSLGPGWDHNHNIRLRELPNRTVQLFDATGRLDEFKPQGDGTFATPKGRFENLIKTGDGFVLTDPEKNRFRFDLFGRLVSYADALATSAGAGNENRLFYDSHSRLRSVIAPDGRSVGLGYGEGGRLEKVQDFDGRAWDYGYDPKGQLVSVKSPSADLGDGSARIEKSYSYSPGIGSDLRGRLNQFGQLDSIKKPDGQSFLDLQWIDDDGDGIPEEMVSQAAGPGTLGVEIDRDTRTATVTDRRGAVSYYTLNAACQPTRFQDPSGAIWAYEYNESGQLTSMVEPLGRVTHYQYVGVNMTRETVVPDARGANGSPATLATQYVYGGTGAKPTVIIDPAGVMTLISRTAAGQPLSITSAAGTPDEVTETFQYNGFGQVTEHVDTSGVRTVYEFDSRGYPVSEEIDPDGAAVLTRFETNPRGLVTAVIDNVGRRIEFDYNALGWKTAMRQAVNGVGPDAPPFEYETRWIYDQNGNVRELQVPYGDGSEHTRQRKTYGLFNQLLTTSTEPEPGTPEGEWLVETRAYDVNLNLIATVDAEGHRQEIQYNFRNLPFYLTHGLGEGELEEPIEEEFVYDGERQLISWIDGRGKTWSQAYDGYGRLARQTDPLGNSSVTEYDAVSQVSAQKVFDSAATLMSHGTALYDRLGRRTSATQMLWDPADPEVLPRPITTQFLYDGASRIRKVIDPEGRVHERIYDTAGRLFEARDPAGNRQTFVYDPSGLVAGATRYEVSSAGEVASATTFGYDSAGRLSWERDALGNKTRYSYNARNQLVEAIDPEGFFTRSEYDGLGRMVRETRPEGIEIRLDYDRRGQLVKYRDAKHQETRYFYDVLGRQTRVTYPDGFSEKFEYDAAGNLVERTDQQETKVENTYDDANRLISVEATPTDPDILGPYTESYSLDGAGRLVLAQSGGTVTERAYDSLSRLVSEKVNGREIRYQRDDADNAEGTTFGSGYQVTRSFDALDRVSQALVGGQAVGSFQYRGPNAVERATLGNGLVRQTTFDLLSRPLSTTVQKADVFAPVMAEHLAWTPRGFKAAVARGDQNGFGKVFAYDGAGRLLGAAAKGEALEGVANNSVAPASLLANAPDAEDFLYDTTLNLLKRGVRENGERSEITSPPDDSGRNRPASVGGAVLEWDANGNLRRKDGQLFLYDWHNRLRQVKNADTGALLASYEYDVFNRRIGKTVGSQSVVFQWDGWNMVEEIGAGDLVLARRIPGLTTDDYLRFEVNLDGVGVPEQIYVPVYDSSGNLVVLTDSAGKPVERYEYSAFGLRRIFVDNTPPEILQVRKVGEEILLELSEEVSLAGARAAAAEGAISLVAGGQSQPLTLEQPVQEGPLARRRLVIKMDGSVASNAAVVLTFAPNALSDSFLNGAPAAEKVYEFQWSTQGVIADTAAPMVERVGVRNGLLEIDFTESINLAAASQVLTLDGAVATWTLDPAGYRLVSTAPLAPGSHAIAVGTGALDLAGQGLSQAFDQAFIVGSEAFELVYQAADPREVGASTVGNEFGFQGLPMDPETGLIYVRNRFYDPELGTFISADPMGYVDGPSMYAFAGSNPVNLKDPLGLQSMRQAIEEYAVDAYSGDNLGKKGWAFLLQAAYATVEMASVGAVGRIDEAQEKLDRGEITRGEYWKETGTAVVKAAAAQLAGGAAGRVAGKVLCPVATRLGLGAGGVRLANGVAGAVAAGAELAASDLVGIATGTQDSMSSVGDYLKTMGTGGLFGVASKLPCHCFTAGTMIATDDGEKPIETIELGDTVWAFNEASQQNELARVVGLFKKEAGNLLLLHVGADILEVTPQHPIYVPEQGWVEAGNLEIGDLLLGRDGLPVVLEDIEWREGLVEVYNFEVEGLHSYFAGQVEVLVHNCTELEGIRKIADEGVSNAVGSIRALDPQARVGYRGSVARGRKGAHKQNGPFDPMDFDIDVFVLSDSLAGRITKNRKGIRWGQRIPEIRDIAKEIDDQVRHLLPGLRKKSTSIRIFSHDEFEEINIPNELRLFGE